MYPQRAKNISTLGTALLRIHPTGNRARIVAQALLENLFFNVEVDEALAYLADILDNLSGITGRIYRGR